ncbi:hypothetical protein EYC59_02960 [Candidatus Saccharibacteria bacterium]|nr:MAG: hypothetical protein EYC59_02960 [Candidatus Saccharibacteria bacterium]
MNRFLYFCSILVLLFFVAGSYLFPNDMIMWFASIAGIDNVIRGGLIVVLLLLMLMPPPRSIMFRVLLGMVSVALVGWSFVTFYAEQLRVLDAIAYVLLSVVFSLAALEITYDSDAPRRATANPQPQLTSL